MTHAIEPKRPTDPSSPVADPDATGTPTRLDRKRQPVESGLPMRGMLMKASVLTFGLILLNVLIGVLSYLVGLLVTVPLSLAVVFLVFRKSFLKKSNRDLRIA